MPRDGTSEIAYVPFTVEYVEGCSQLEAEAFNRLREEWRQPLQAPRNAQWLRYFAQRHPDQGQAALRGDLPIGYCLVNVWGRLGWLGPVAVHPAHQGNGVGRTLVAWGRECLARLGCSTIALETWPHNLDNIGLYLKTGFDPGPLVLVFESGLPGRRAPFTARSFGSQTEREGALSRMKELTESVAPGLDYGPLMRATLDCGLGEVLFWENGAQAEAAAVLHYQSHFEAPPPTHANLEVLLIRPGEEGRLEAIVEELEGRARYAGKARLRLSLSSHHIQGVRFILKRGYRLRKSRLRMYHVGGPVAAEKVDYLSYVV
jgi:GNAT superfamily N-acetyltransferase